MSRPHVKRNLSINVCVSLHCSHVGQSAIDRGRWCVCVKKALLVFLSAGYWSPIIYVCLAHNSDRLMVVCAPVHCSSHQICDYVDVHSRAGVVRLFLCVGLEVYRPTETAVSATWWVVWALDYVFNMVHTKPTGQKHVRLIHKVYHKYFHESRALRYDLFPSSSS